VAEKPDYVKIIYGN